MHQRRAGNGVASGLQNWDHVQQLLNGRPCALELPEDIGMMSEVMREVAVQCLTLRAVLHDAAQLAPFLLICRKERQGLEELAIGLAKDVQDVREELADVEVHGTPVPGTFKRQHAQLLASIQAHVGAELQDLVDGIPRPYGQALARLVRNGGALDLELVVANVAVVLCVAREHRVVHEGELRGSRGDDVIVADGRLVHGSRAHVHPVASGRGFLAQRQLREAKHLQDIQGKRLVGKGMGKEKEDEPACQSSGSQASQPV